MNQARRPRRGACAIEEAKADTRTAMSTPIVSENTRRLESVTHDTFIDDLATTRGAESVPSPSGRPVVLRWPRLHAESDDPRQSLCTRARARRLAAV